MRIEVLYPEVGNLCGDLMNVRYLQQCCPALEVVETGLKDRPAFVDGGVSLLYLGTATERGMQLIVQALEPWKEQLAAYVDGGGLMLATGNALDVLGAYVMVDGKRAFDGLGLLPTHAEYHMMKRHNSFMLGSFQDMAIVGFKSLFGHSYPEDELAYPLFRVERGVGRHPGSFTEGFRRGGLLATYLTGPLLPLNPPFTRWLLEQMGVEQPQIAFEETAMRAYEARVEEFRDESRNYQY